MQEKAKPPLSRIQRRRQGTLDEIVDVARAQLRANEAVSISSIASELGMTPPALYRYVPSLAGLHDLVSRAIIDDVIRRITAAADRQQEPGARLVAAATAFRQWALHNYAEYRAAFAPQGGPLSTPRSSEEPMTATEMASSVFAIIVNDVMHRYLPEALESVPVPEHFLAAYERMAPRHPLSGKVASPATAWLFERAWVKFLGCVSYETFGFLDPEIVVSGDLFVSILIEIGSDLGLADEMDRLLAIAVETAIWTDEQDGVQPLHVQLEQAEQRVTLPGE